MRVRLREPSGVLQTVDMKSSVQSSGGDQPIASLPLVTLIDNEALGQRLESLRVKQLADLWFLIALHHLTGDVEGIVLLERLATHLAARASPFLPKYWVNYSISVKSEANASSDQLPDPDLCVTTYKSEIGLPSGTIICHATVPSKGGLSSGDPAIPEELALRLMQSADVHPTVEISPPDIGWQGLLRPIRVPLLAEVLGAVEKTGLRRKEVIVRRRGLVSGDAETLEVIAEDLGLTRERVRQLESKAVEAVASRKSFGISLASTLRSCSIITHAFWR